MDLDTLIAHLHQHEIHLHTVADELRIQAPPGRMTPDLQAQIRQHKAALLRYYRPLKMKFSLFFFGVEAGQAAHRTYDLVLEAARFADQHGFSALWFPERHFHPLGAPFPNPAVLATAVAPQTRRIKLRAGSVVLPLQDPVRVAESWAMVDQLSRGRVELSFTSGRWPVCNGKALCTPTMPVPIRPWRRWIMPSAMTGCPILPTNPFGPGPMYPRWPRGIVRAWIRIFRCMR